MALKKVGVTNLKLKAGSSVQGYLLGHSIQRINGDNGEFDLCKCTLKDEKLGPVTVWLQGDYGHVLVNGLMTKISKVEIQVDGEKQTRTDVEQDDADKITV